MMTIDLPNVDLEQGQRRSSASSCGTEESICSFHSANEDSFDDYRFACYDTASVAEFPRSSSASECCVDVMNLRSLLDREDRENKGKENRACRICSASFDGGSTDAGVVMELGCCCKGDLGAAHKYCAETWFKYKENKICEICKTEAHNVDGENGVESSVEPTNSNAAASIESLESTSGNAVPNVEHHVPLRAPEVPSFWNGHRFMKLLLTCLVFAFIVLWLFRIN